MSRVLRWTRPRGVWCFTVAMPSCHVCRLQHHPRVPQCSPTHGWQLQQGAVQMHIALGHAAGQVAEQTGDRQLGKAEVAGYTGKSVTENMWRHVTSATLCSNRTASTLSSTPAGDAWTCEILVADSILTLPDIGVVLPLAEPREDRLRGARALRSGSQIRACLTFSSPRALAPSPARPEASVGDVRPPSLIFGPLNALNAQPGIVTPRRACGPSGGPVVEGDG